MHTNDSEPVIILIIDEDNVTTTAVESALQKRGHGGLVAREASALPVLAGQAISLVLLGLPISGSDNVEAYKRLRANPTIGDQPIILLSAVTQAEARDELLAMGANDFITKPFSPSELLTRIETHLRLARLEAVVGENTRLLSREQSQRRQVEELYRKQAELAQEISASQEQLLQSAKLAATGRLAASWAHEINNPLQAVHSCLQLAIHFDLEPAKQAEFIGMASEEVERMIDIVTRILDFARPSPSQLEPTNINRIISKVIRLASKHMAHNQWEVQQNLASDIPEVEVIPDQMAQLFLNIVLNAFDAMPDGGKLYISTSYQKDWVLIRLRDTGTGIPPDIQAHIFEPFFTTKSGASGLGLSLSYGIVSRHGGHIEVESAEGEGTTFTIFLPLVHREAIKQTIKEVV